MADHLDIALPIVTKDDLTGEYKATAYFENYLYEIISTLGGEGATIIEELVATTIEAGKFPQLFSLVNSLRSQVDNINDSISLQHRLEAAVKQIEIDTAGFIAKVKTSNYTAENKDWVEARSKAIITLPADPLVNDQVIVSNGDGSLIKINGNGNNIKYTTTNTNLKTSRQGSSFHFQLFEDESTKYWRIR